MNSTVSADDDYSNVEQFALISLNVFEFVSHIFLDCPFAALNFFFIFTTSILHSNLKFILLCQSGCIFIRGIVRFEILLEDFWTGQIVSTDGGDWQLRAMLAPIYFRNYLAHVLFIERLMATLWAKNYEKWRGWHFSAIWFSIVMGLTTLNMLHTSQQVGFLTWLTFGFVLTLALIELFLSENVRTTKQMLVPLLLHLINLCLGSAVTTIAFYRPFANKFCYDFFGQLTLAAVSICNFLIELTMIL
ncbi:hypothetical protein niasHT_018261 [Heterodera trifolii]|uniref:Uncharacterized protein n=1 Tax=Heterodera trifolii TaxID=157864 RepID=A0ABD2L5J5_9BILA